MKKIAITIGAVLFTLVGVQAQNNRDVKKETTTKKVTTTDTYNTNVQVVEEIDEEVEVLEVPENGMQDQTATKVTNKSDSVNVLTNETKVDTKKKMMDENAPVITAANAKRELEKSVMMQANEEKLKMAKYDANQKMLEMERLERKAVLMKRVGQTAEDAKMNSAEYQLAKKEYEMAADKAEKAEMMMKQM